MTRDEFYTAEEFHEWLNNHPEVVSVDYYSGHYKSFKDDKLPHVKMDKYFILYYGKASSPKFFWWDSFKKL